MAAGPLLIIVIAILISLASLGLLIYAIVDISKAEFPGQGTLIWIDSMTVLAEAQNKDDAWTFIDYMLRPEVIADATNFVFYANANAAATELVDPEISGDPHIYPPAEVRERLFSETVLANRAQRLRTRTWTRIKTAN